MNEQISNYIKALQKIITPQLNQAQKRHKSRAREYEHIDLNIELFIKQIDALHSIYGHYKGFYDLKFVDVGCGSGTKLILAHTLGLKNLEGIEVTKRYVQAAKKNAPYANIIHNNAMNVDYSQYDIIYFYCPMCDRKKQAELEELIVRSAKKGAYILANQKQHSLLWTHPDKVKRIYGDVIYQKI